MKTKRENRIYNIQQTRRAMTLNPFLFTTLKKQTKHSKKCQCKECRHITQYCIINNPVIQEPPKEPCTDDSPPDLINWLSCNDAEQMLEAGDPSACRELAKNNYCLQSCRQCGDNAVDLEPAVRNRDDPMVSHEGTPALPDCFLSTDLPKSLWEEPPPTKPNLSCNVTDAKVACYKPCENQEPLAKGWSSCDQINDSNRDELCPSMKSKNYCLKNCGMCGTNGNPEQQFDVDFYLNTYDDINKAFYHDKKQAVQHWVATGNKEGRMGCKTCGEGVGCITNGVFDADYYMSKYRYLNMSSPDEAKQHWLSGGSQRLQGCDMCCTGRACFDDGAFDAKYYADRYLNLKLMDEQSAIDHWQTTGKQQRLVGCKNCCPGTSSVV